GPAAGRGNYRKTGGDVPPDFADPFGGGSPIGGFPHGGRPYPGGSPTRPKQADGHKGKATLTIAETEKGATSKHTIPGGKPLTVRTPVGVKDGQKVRLRGKGKSSPNGGEAGDLILTVNVKPHPVFTRDGDNLRMELPVSFDEAALRAEVSVPTLGG